MRYSPLLHTWTKGRIYLATVVTRTLLIELREIYREREKERSFIVTTVLLCIYLPLAALLVGYAWSLQDLVTYRCR